MKKLLFFILVLVFSTTSAQEVTTMLRAGGSFAGLHFKSENNFQGLLTGYAGIAVNVDLENQLFLQPELLYSLRGYKFPPTGFNSGGKVKYGYITAPLLVGYKLSKNFFILAGPEIGYMVRARSKFDGQTIDVISNVSRRFNVDADAGIAVNITKELKFDARFSFGVTALYRGILTDENGGQIGTLKDGYHRVLQFGLALAL